MKYVGNITSEAKQNIKLITEDGSKVNFTLEFKPMQEGWFFSFSWGGIFSVNNRRLTTCLNMLRQFREILPFGFACTTTDGYEPIFQDDFIKGRAQFYILNSNDVGAVETKIASFDERIA